MPAERVRVINGKREIDIFLDKSDVILVAYIDYNKDKRLYRQGSKLYEYKDTIVYAKILGTVPQNETVKEFIHKNKDQISQYDIVFLEVYQNPERISFNEITSEGML